MSAVSSFYTSVINEVIDNLKAQFNEEGIDPAALNDLKELWEKKIKESGALEPPGGPKHAPPASQFSSILHHQQQHNGGITQIQQGLQGGRGNTAGSRLIKPCGNLGGNQGSQATILTVSGDHSNSNYNNSNNSSHSNSRMTTMPLFHVQTTVGGGGAAGGQYRGNTMAPPRNIASSSMYNFYNGNQQATSNYDFMLQQVLKDNRMRQENSNNSVGGAFSYRNNTVPMVIHTNQPQGVALFNQYHNIIPNQTNTTGHIITDNNSIVNLRKNQTDGVDDNSSDEEDDGGDFVNVSEVDPLSVRPPLSNITRYKREAKQEETDDDEDVVCDEEIDVINNSSIHPSKKEDESEDDDDDEPDREEEECKEEAPLNSEDDISDDDPEKIFETENVIVCQYDKVNRTRNKWKLNFVSGIANLYGKDTVFHKAVGEAEW